MMMKMKMKKRRYICECSNTNEISVERGRSLFIVDASLVTSRDVSSIRFHKKDLLLIGWFEDICRSSYRIRSSIFVLDNKKKRIRNFYFLSTNVNIGETT